MTRSLAVAFLAGACVTGCTTQAWYESTKRNAELECQGQPQAAYEECMSRVNRKSYQEYQRERSGVTAP